MADYEAGDRVLFNTDQQAVVNTGLGAKEGFVVEIKPDGRLVVDVDGRQRDVPADWVIRDP